MWTVIRLSCSAMMILFLAGCSEDPNGREYRQDSVLRAGLIHGVMDHRNLCPFALTRSCGDRPIRSMAADAHDNDGSIIHSP